MIKEFEDVKIKKTGITGTVVDIYTVNGKTFYTVECDRIGDKEIELVKCELNEIEKV